MSGNEERRSTMLVLNISGMDESGFVEYEQYCQQMLRTGLEYVEVCGYVFDVESEEHRKNLQNYIGERHQECSGYQAISVTSHVCYITKKGRDVWLEENPERHLLIDVDTCLPAGWENVKKCSADCEYTRPEGEMNPSFLAYCTKIEGRVVTSGMKWCVAKLKE